MLHSPCGTPQSPEQQKRLEFFSKNDKNDRLFQGLIYDVGDSPTFPVLVGEAKQLENSHSRVQNNDFQVSIPNGHTPSNSVPTSNDTTFPCWPAKRASHAFISVVNLKMAGG